VGVRLNLEADWQGCLTGLRLQVLTGVLKLIWNCLTNFQTNNIARLFWPKKILSQAKY